MGEDLLRYSNKIESSDKTISLWSLTDQPSVFKRCHSKEHLWEFYPHNGVENQLA